MTARIQFLLITLLVAFVSSVSHAAPPAQPKSPDDAFLDPYDALRRRTVTTERRCRDLRIKRIARDRHAFVDDFLSELVLSAGQ